MKGDAFNGRISPDTSGRIRVTSPYNAEVVARLRTVKTRKWHPDGKYWSFENSKPILTEVLSVLAGDDLDIDPSLGVSPPRKAYAAKPLLERTRHLIRLKHYSMSTEKTYLSWMERYLLFYNNRDPKEMTGKDVEAFLSHLAVKEKVSASTQNQAFNALLFLYREVLNKDLGQCIDAIRAKKPQRLPTVMTKDVSVDYVTKAISLRPVAKGMKNLTCQTRKSQRSGAANSAELRPRS